MKKEIIIILLLACFFASDTFAQRKFPYHISHPSIHYAPARPDISIDTSYYYNYADGEDPFPYKTYYTRSDDLLTDTVHFPLSIYIYRYNEKNQLIYGHNTPTKMFGVEEYMRTDFEHDQEGRLIRRRVTFVDPNTLAVKEGDVKTWDYSNIQKTDKGFIFNDVECELDEEGRITHIRPGNHIDRYAEYINGEIYRVNDSFYAYTDSSCTLFGCFPYFDHPHEIAESPIHWMKDTIVYTENGDVKSKVMYTSDDGINWYKRHDSRTVYIYNGNNQTHSGGGGVSNGNIQKANTVVYALPGAIFISVGDAATVQIFDLTGRLVKRQDVPQGESRVNVESAGLYLVKVGNESFKIFVKTL